jgi:T5SS/PEP-CTERM-associated repeat protein
MWLDIRRVRITGLGVKVNRLIRAIVGDGWRRFLALVIAVCIAPAEPLLGQTEWQNTGFGDWNEPANWTAGVPTATTDAIITNDATAVLATPGAQVQDLILGDLVDTSGVLSITTTGISTGALSGRDLVVGWDGTGTLNIDSGGVLTMSTSPSVALATGSTGTVTVSGTGSAFNNADQLQIAVFGTGSLDISGGAQVTNTLAVVGWMAGSDGTATVTGAGSTWTNSSELHIASEGTAVLEIMDGGQVSNTFAAVGLEAGSNGTASVGGEGSLWTSSTELHIGYGGVGELTIDAGGEVRSDVGVIGTSPGSNGTATVTGDGSTWALTDQLLVGVEGIGTVLIEEGAIVTAEGVRVGFVAGGDGELTITGGGSSVTSGQQVQIGQLSAGDLVLSDGALLDSKKGTSPTNTSGIIGTEPTGVGIATITGAGTRWEQDGGMNVGFRGMGTMNVQEGAVIHSADGIIARFDVATGTVTVSGANSSWLVDNELHVGGSAAGDGGTATLNVSADASVSVGSLLRVWNGGTVSLTGGTLTADSIQHNDGGAFNFTGGTLHVETFTGNLTNSGGTLAPGASPGTTTIAGNYAQDSGTLQIELASPDNFDKLVVNGDLTLGGTLSVLLLDDYSPAAGATFDILNWTNLTGTFSTLQLPTLAGSLTWNTTGLYTDGVLAVDGEGGLMGDYNSDGAVNAADYVVWRKNNGTQEEYDRWRANFGRPPGAGAAAAASSGSIGSVSAAVPEPEAATLMLLGISATYLLSRAARSNRRPWIAAATSVPVAIFVDSRPSLYDVG